MKISDISKLAEAVGGVPLYGTLPGSPSAMAGLKAGDIVMTINGERTKSLSDYVRITSGIEEMEVTVLREGEELTVSFTKRRSTQPLAEVAEFVSKSKFLQAPVRREEEEPN